AQSAEARIDERAIDRRQTLLDQQQIHRVVAGGIPTVAQAVIAAREVSQRAVQRLVGEHELRLTRIQAPNVRRAVIDPTCIGGYRLAPAGGLEGQMQQQHADEGLVQNEPGARGGKLRLRSVVARAAHAEALAPAAPLPSRSCSSRSLTLRAQS